jgi:hypothetical protein
LHISSLSPYRPGRIFSFNDGAAGDGCLVLRGLSLAGEIGVAIEGDEVH